MNPMKSLLLTMSILTLICLGPIRGADEPAPQTNVMCPVLTDEKIDPEISVEYKGKKVFLCCGKCRVKFLKSPEQYLPNLPQFSAVSSHTNTPHTDEAPTSDIGPVEMHNHLDYELVTTAKPQHDHDHDHDHGSDQPSGFSHLLSYMGRFHPLAVHLPIALILIAGLLEFFGWVTKRDLFTKAGRINFCLGTISALAAAPLGWASAAFSRYPGMEDTVFWHRWMGTSLAGLATVTVCVLWANYRHPNPKLDGVYRALLVILCVMVAITGHLGGSLVFGADHLNW